MLKSLATKGEFECPTCQKVFGTPRGLGGHLSHGKCPDQLKRKSIQCPVCKKEFRDPWNLKRHSKSHLISGPGLAAIQTRAKQTRVEKRLAQAASFLNPTSPNSNEVFGTETIVEVRVGEQVFYRATVCGAANEVSDALRELFTEKFGKQNHV